MRRWKGSVLSIDHGPLTTDAGVRRRRVKGQKPSLTAKYAEYAKGAMSQMSEDRGRRAAEI